MTNDGMANQRRSDRKTLDQLARHRGGQSATPGGVGDRSGLCPASTAWRERFARPVNLGTGSNP